MQNRTAELQEALLSLGDRTSELESQNRRFNAVLRQMSEGLVLSDRSGVITNVNRKFCQLFDVKEEAVVGIPKKEWYQFLGQYSIQSEEEWNKSTLALDCEQSQSYTYQLQCLTGREQTLSCRTSPILDKENKLLGRIWIFE